MILPLRRERHRFVGFWDVDEFLVPLDPGITSLPSFLARYEAYGGLAVNWRTVGPSGHDHPPQSGTLESYQRCTPWDWPDNAGIKTIVNTRLALHPTTDPHSFVYSDAAHAVDAERRRVEGTRNEAMGEAWLHERRAPALALYHYVTKSREEYREKMRRGSAMGNRKDEAFFERVRAAADVACPEAVAACRRMKLEQCGGGGAGGGGETAHVQA